MSVAPYKNTFPHASNRPGTMLMLPIKALSQCTVPADTIGPWVEKSRLKHHKIQIQSFDFLLTVTLTCIEARERAGREIPILL